MSKYKLKKNTGQNCIFSLLQLIIVRVYCKSKEEALAEHERVKNALFLLIIMLTVIMYKL